MKCTIKRPVEVDIKYLIANLGCFEERVYDEPFTFNEKEYYDFSEFYKDYPQLRGEYLSNDSGFTIELKIDVETGKVVNWPQNCPFDFHDIKIVDTGTYKLIDVNDNIIAEYSGYVPECIGYGGYGDYLEFEITEDSIINDWEFDDSHVAEIIDCMYE